jgi:hypothetical protein
MKMTALALITDAMAIRDFEAAANACDTLAATENPDTINGWYSNLKCLASVLRTGAPHWNIFMVDGNSKLPFAAFSALPGKAFCPGAGDCLLWCYSFKAWRYPAAFCRQVQNTFLLSDPLGQWYIVRALDEIAHQVSDVRIYVDGDFRDQEDVSLWAQLMRMNPGVNFYGYSKSFRLLLDAHAAGTLMPTNYTLNISGGHNADDATVQQMLALPYVRGHFKAVSIGRKVRNADHGKRETNSALRAAYGRKAFPCPGKCGTCTPKGHACGSAAFKGIDIIIAVH